MVFFLEQLLNGLNYGLLLFLIAAGLSLVFGVMHLINLAHGSLFMVGAFVTVAVAGSTGSFWSASASWSSCSSRPTAFSACGTSSARAAIAIR